MQIDDKFIKEISVILVVLLFGILVFFAIQPLIFAVIWGLLLAYIFYPLYKIINKRIKNKTFAVTLILILIILVIIIPLWYVAPVIIQQVFEFFRSSQSFDIAKVIQNLFPTSSAQLTLQLSTAINTVIGKATSAVTSYLIGFFLDIPLLLVNLFVVAFVFFFTLRDSDKLIEFIKGISPLSKVKEKLFIKNFKDITYSVIYGRIIVGLIQGILAGIGFFVFGVDNALILSLIGILLCILPIIGVFLIWIPIAVYMFLVGDVTIGIAFVLYNVIIVSQIDNILLAYFVSKRTNLSALFTLISSVGGLFLFGIIGVILGPLIFAYFIILIDLYREKNLLSLFSSEEVKEEVKSSESK